jgi:hypothetical protein
VFACLAAIAVAQRIEPCDEGDPLRLDVHDVGLRARADPHPGLCAARPATGEQGVEAIGDGLGVLRIRLAAARLVEHRFEIGQGLGAILALAENPGDDVGAILAGTRQPNGGEALGLELLL